MCQINTPLHRKQHNKAHSPLNMHFNLSRSVFRRRHTCVIMCTVLKILRNQKKKYHPSNTVDPLTVNTIPHIVPTNTTQFICHLKLMYGPPLGGVVCTLCALCNRFTAHYTYEFSTYKALSSNALYQTQTINQLDKLICIKWYYYCHRVQHFRHHWRH